MSIAAICVKLLDQWMQLGALAAQGQPVLDVRHPGTSDWCLGQHVEHLWLIADRRLNSFATLLALPPGSSDLPADVRASGGPRFMGRMVLLTGFIPRGKAKAPGPVVPQGLSAATLAEGFAGLPARLAKFDTQAMARCPWRISHPFLGDFRIAQWLRFMDVHHRHHTKIMRDISRAAGAALAV